MSAGSVIDKSFYSNGKLLLTGEYAVLHGALALALPLRFGQSMHVTFTPGAGRHITWIATDPTGTWFRAHLALDPALVARETTDTVTAGRLIRILNAARDLSENLFEEEGSWVITSRLSFNRAWGWGSSSSLIANLARWAGLDPFLLNRLVSDGSGFDIACAGASSPLLYRSRPQLVEPLDFNPPFRDHLAFIYLGDKQDTAGEIRNFNPDPDQLKEAIASINDLTRQIAKTTELEQFNHLVEHHEIIIGNLIGREPVRERLYSDFNGAVKSLGAWGGDFILASSAEGFESIQRFFRYRGNPIAFHWSEIIL